MQNLRNELQSILRVAIEKAVAAGELPNIELGKIIVQYPPANQAILGDYATPIALAIGKKSGKNPMEVATIIVKNIEPSEFFIKTEIIEPGFINFFLNPQWLTKKLDDVTEEGDRFGSNNQGSGQTINLEFVSANPTGMPTFGNGRALFWADSLGRVLEKSGWAVTREYYINDVGNQVRIFGESILRSILRRRGIDVEYPENMYQGDDVKIIAQKVEELYVEDVAHEFSEKDLADEAFINSLARKSVDTVIEEIRKMIEEKCKVHFDVWFSERTLHEKGEVADVLEKLKKAGLSYEKDDAVWFKATEFGDDKDRVLVKGDGHTTYFAPDIAYHLDKLGRGFSKIVNFWGADHHGDVKRLLGGVKAVGGDVEKIQIILTQMVAVIEGGERKKMSKRAGTAIPLDKMVEEAGLSAARFILCMNSLSSHMDFDVDLAKEQTDRNPVYYVQYAYVRLASIIRKAKETNVLDGVIPPPVRDIVPLRQVAEHELMRQVYRFPEIVDDVATSWEVHRLPHYAIELAKSIHYFYDTVHVLNNENRNEQITLILLILAARQTLGNVLDLLGVEKIQVM
ncbi:MAG: arginine--tRNA ligase [bacterium]|nr:arginine--tRNA ligase [bacterium]